jgi:UDP-glucose 4-epimerase
MEILILGGAGFIGTNLIQNLIEFPNQYSISALDIKNGHFGRSIFEDSKINFFLGSINDQELLKKIVIGKDIIINLAAQTSHTLPSKFPLENTEANINGNLCVLEAIRHHNPGCKYIYVSTSSVVGKSNSEYIDESHSKWALDLYSVSKGAAENFCFSYAHSYGLKILVVRFPNIYGPYGHNDPSYGVINYFLNQALAGKALTIYGTGEQKRSVLFVDDAIDSLKSLFFCDDLYDGFPVFVASNKHYSIKEIAMTISEKFGCSSPKFISWPEDRKSIEIGDVQILCSRLKDYISWSPKYGLEKGIRESAKRMRYIESNLNTEERI